MKPDPRPSYDFVKFAEAHGAVGMRLEKGQDLGELLEGAFAKKAVVVVECPIDYSVNYETFSREIESLVCEL